MKHFVIHDSTGRIIQTGAVIEAILHMQGDPDKGKFLLEGEGDLDRSWVQDGKIVDRPALACRLSARTVPADGTASTTLSGVPEGAAIEIFGPISAAGDATGEDITLTFAKPGRYAVVIKLFPYLDTEEIIHAV